MMGEGLPFLFVAQAASPLGGAIGGPYLKWCAVCGLFIDCETEESAKITFLNHVGRAHELEYLQATGHVPTPDHMKLQEYLVREGFQ